MFALTPPWPMHYAAAALHRCPLTTPNADAHDDDSMLVTEVPSDAESVEFTAGNPR